MALNWRKLLSLSLMTNKCKNLLHVIYKSLVAEGKKPRELQECPRTDLTMEKWLKACNFIEKTTYQERSATDAANRAKMPFNHTSGRTPMLIRYKDMVEKSEIEHFKNTRVSKKRGGEFVNTTAQSTYEDMVNMKRQAEEHGEQFSEAEIVRRKLGRRSGYVKGMGHGIEVIRGSRSTNMAGIDFEEKLSELENAKEEIVCLA